MKNIQWFPGHMTKAMRDMEAKRDLCDGVICVLDARAPIATVNKNLKKIFGAKPILYVLNKADLADGKADAFVKFLEDRGCYAVKCDSTNISTKRILLQRLNAITEEKRERERQRGENECEERERQHPYRNCPEQRFCRLRQPLGGQKRAASQKHTFDLFPRRTVSSICGRGFARRKNSRWESSFPPIQSPL